MHSITINSGELVDRLIILQLKYKVASEDVREAILRNVRELEDIYKSQLCIHEGMDARKQQLQRINQALWVLEDDIRREDIKDKSHISYQIAVVNDIRSLLKQEIDRLAGEQTSECKTYTNKYSRRYMAETWIRIEREHLNSELLCERGGGKDALEIFLRFLQDQFAVQLSANEIKDLAMLSVGQIADMIDT